MSELIVEKIAPQSEILDIKGKLKLQGNLETTGTFLSSFLNVKPNDLDITSLIINDRTGFGISLITDNTTFALNSTNPNKGIKFHTITGSRKVQEFNTLTVGNVQGGSGSIEIIPSTPSGQFLSTIQDKVEINTTNFLVKDDSKPLIGNPKSSLYGLSEKITKSEYSIVTTGSKVFLGSVFKTAKSSSISQHAKSTANYSYIRPGSTVIRGDLHALGKTTHIHGFFKVGEGTYDVTGSRGIMSLSDFTGGNGFTTVPSEVDPNDVEYPVIPNLTYSGSITIKAGRETIEQATILNNIEAGLYGFQLQQTHQETVAGLDEFDEYNFVAAIAEAEAIYGAITSTPEFFDSSPTQILTFNHPEWVAYFESPGGPPPTVNPVITITITGVPSSFAWQLQYPAISGDYLNGLISAAEGLQLAQDQALTDVFFNPLSPDYIGTTENQGRDGQPSIFSKGSLTIGLDGLGLGHSRFFEILSGIDDVSNYASADTLFLVDDNTKKTYVQHLSSSGDLFASMSEAPTTLDDQLRQHVIVVDTASGQFFFTGSYGGSDTGGETTFISLEDTPDEYETTTFLTNEEGETSDSQTTISTAGQILAVNSTSNGIEFTTSSLIFSASHASSSISSSHADNAISASFASSSTSASFASSSISASFASNSISASHADNASSATSASHADNSINAVSASYVENALTKFLSLTDVSSTIKNPFNLDGNGFGATEFTIGAIPEDTPNVSEEAITNTNEGVFTGLTNFIPIVNLAGTKLQLTHKVPSASFVDSTLQATTALTGGIFQAGAFGITTEEASNKFQMPAGFNAYGLSSTIEGNLSVSGTLAVSDALTIADIQISSSDGAFSFGSGSVNDITHQMTGNLQLSSSIGITANMPDNTVGFVGTASFAETASHAQSSSHADNVISASFASSSISASFASSSTSASFASSSTSASFSINALTASYAENAGSGGGVGFPYSGSDIITSTGASAAVITGSLFLSGSGHITASGTISASDGFTGSLYGTASWSVSSSNVVSASMADTSISASFASSSTSASFASSSTSASFASSSTSASFASSSTSASFASSSTSASFASSSTSASYASSSTSATSASHADNTISASFASSSTSASFASSSTSASFATNALSSSYINATDISLTFPQLSDVSSIDVDGVASYPGGSNGHVAVVNSNNNGIVFTSSVTHAGSASFADETISSSFASSSISASYADNVATAFTDLSDVSDSLKDEDANPVGDTLLAGLAEYALQISSVGNKLEAVIAVKSASQAQTAINANTASKLTLTEDTTNTSSFLAFSREKLGNQISTDEGLRYIASTSTLSASIFSASTTSDVGFVGTASYAESSSHAVSASYIDSNNIGDLTFLNLDDTPSTYGTTGDVLVLDGSTLAFSGSAPNATSASHADNASNAVSSSHTDNTISASMADTTITASFASSSISASFVMTGGLSDVGFYAFDTTIQGDLEVTGSVAIAGGLTINDIQVSSSVDAFVFGSGSENDVVHQMTGNLSLSASTGITVNMPVNTIGFVGTASFAETASVVTGTVLSASFASSSTSASFASSSTSASFASSSTSASFASSSISASFASTSISASHVDTTISASFASSSTSASFASSSTSASFASSSTSASFSTNALTASFALGILSDGDITGNLIGNVTGDLTGSVSGNLNGTASFLESFLSMSDTPSTYANSGSFVLQVAPDATEIHFVKTIESASFASESISSSFASTASYISTSNIAGLITDFIDLDDTANDYPTDEEGLYNGVNYSLQLDSSNNIQFVELVHSASHANAASSATSASHADNASSATSASHADNASSATSASHADNSINAVSASHADNAISSSFASSSTSASFASSSTSASFASSSTSASFASSSISASFASSSTSASFATNALTASYVENASSGEGVGFPYSGSDVITSTGASAAVITGSLFLSGSGHITASGVISASDGFTGSLYGTASYALNASSSVSASFASSSTSASYASSSTSASFASSSISASFASSSTSASFASSSISASFASSSTSASFASSSTSASFASSSTSASFASSSISASHADNASNTTSASYALNSQHIYVDTRYPDGNQFNIAETSHSILFASDASRGYDQVTGGAGYTDVGVSSSFTFNPFEEKVHAKIFSASIVNAVGFEGTASYVESASHASNTDNATSASHSDTSISASYASTSFSASHADIAISASYASTSFSASHADVAISSSYASSSTSASYADDTISSSFATLAISGGFTSGNDPFHVQYDAEVMGDLSVSGSVAIGAGLTINNIQISSSEGAFSFGTGSNNTIIHQMTGNLHMSSSIGIMVSMSANTVGFHGTASYAETASFLTGNVISASYASSSTSASFASSSTSASYADNVISASFASSSTSASYASSSTSASYADNVISASFASSSTSASYASSSTSASYASSSTSASYASSSTSASYASSSTSASYASSSTSASYASSSTSASYASSSTSASYASSSTSASYASSSTSASFASSSTSASFASSSTSASYASSSTSASYASSSTSASYADNTNEAVSASFASGAGEIIVTNYAKNALIKDNDKVHLTFVTEPDYTVTDPTITDDVPEGGVPLNASTMSKLYAWGDSDTDPSHQGLTYTPSEDLLHTTTSFALSASHATNASTNYIDLTDTEDLNYTGKDGFVPVVKESSALPNDGALILLQTVPSASVALSSSYALTASYVEGVDGGAADTAEVASNVIILEPEDRHRLIMVTQNEEFGDGAAEKIRETDNLLWIQSNRRLGINAPNSDPFSELHLGGVEYIEGGIFNYSQFVFLSGDDSGIPVEIPTQLPSNLAGSPYAEASSNLKPATIMPIGTGIYSIDDLTNNSLSNSTGLFANHLQPWSVLIAHRKDNKDNDTDPATVQIGDPFSDYVGDMELFVGGTRASSGGGFYFNPHGSLPPTIIDPTTVDGIIAGPHNQPLLNTTATLTIEKGTPSDAIINTSGQGSVGIRTRRGILYNSKNALYVNGAGVMSDSLVIGRRYTGTTSDTYNPLSPNIATEFAGIQIDPSKKIGYQFEIHHSEDTTQQLSNGISSIRFAVSEKSARSAYHINHIMDDDGYFMYNDATANRPIKITSLQKIDFSDTITEHVATDRIHINNLSGTVTIGPNLWYLQPNGTRVSYGQVEDAFTYDSDGNVVSSDQHTDHKFVVNGRSRMNGRLHIEGVGKSPNFNVNLGFANQSGSSDFGSGDGGYPLLKVESQDANDDSKFLVHFKSKDDDNAKILKLESNEPRFTTNGTHFVEFLNSTGVIGSIKQVASSNQIVYNQTSDRRLKTDIKSVNELDNLLKLNPVSYKWKGGDKEDIGLIAQEVDKIYPNLVDKSDEERLQMNYMGLIPVLLSGIKEQQKIIDSLEKRIKKLENK